MTLRTSSAFAAVSTSAAAAMTVRSFGPRRFALLSYSSSYSAFTPFRHCSTTAREKATSGAAGDENNHVDGAPAAATAAAASTSSASSSSSSGEGYAFFEDQYSQASAPTPRFESYEEQMLSATAKNMDPPKQKSEHEKLVELHDWGEDEKTKVPIVPENYGWNEEWGPEPGEDGHNAWYRKDRTYMSTEEKAKYDMGMQCAVRKNMIRHQELPYQKRVGAGSRNLVEDQPMFYSTKDKGVMAPYSERDKKDYVAPARQQFIDEWLDKPGVTPENIGKKIGDYNGTAKKHTVKAVPRKPDWQLAPIEDD